MSKARATTLAVLSLRVAYGAGLIAAPRKLAGRWLGEGASHAASQVPLRGLGAREVVFHAGALAAALRGQAVRPWLAGSIAGDLADLAATVTGRHQLPEGSAGATVLVAGGSALLSLALAVGLER